MSKSSAASAPKLSTPLPQRSAWSKGPPNTSSAPTPRTQSPAPASTPTSATPSHSRRPSTLGHGVAFKDGVAGARSPVGAPKSGAAVTFGSIDDVSAPLSSSPASVPAIKADPPKTFGTVSAQATPIPAVNGKPSPSSFASVSTSAAKPSTPAKFDVKKLFQGNSSGPSSSSSSQPPSESVSSPSTRPAPLPQHPSPQASSSHTPQASQYNSHSFQTFVPSGGLRPSPNGTNANGPPRSPVYPRQTPNGTAPPSGVNGRPQGGPGSSPAPPTPMSAGMPSPRMGPPHTGQPPAMQPGPVPWNAYYYYPNMPDYMYPAPQWQMPHVVQQPQHPHTPGAQPHPLPPPHQHQQPGMPMSPRHPQPSLHPPGTPTMPPAVPIPTASPHVQTANLSVVTSPPSTPASATGPGAAAGHMNQNAKPFVPGKRVTLKNPSSGHELDLETFKKHGSSGSVSSLQIPVPGSPARKAIRMETEEAKKARLAEEEKVKKEKEEKERAKREAEQKVKREEEERIQKEKREAERVQREKEEAERRKKEEEEKERIRKEEEEKDRVRKAEEEKERVRKEEEERLRKEAEEKEQLEREEKERQQLEVAERVRKEAEVQERVRKDTEAKEAAVAAAAAVEKTSAPEVTAEDGEVGEKDGAAQDEARDKVLDKPPLRLDTTLDRKRPGPLDLSGTKGPIAQPLPSALATARIIEDITSIDYPEGIKSPQVELNMNAKQGKFRYDRDFLLQFMAVCKEKPDSLPPLDAIGLEPSDQHFAPMSRGGSGRRQASIGGMPPPSSTSRQGGAVGLGISGFKPSSGFTMGQFATPKSSEERFAMSSRSSSVSGGPAGLPFGRGPGAVPMGSNRTRSKRGEKRNNNAPSQPSAFGNNAAMQGMLEPVAPLEVSANRWQPNSITRKAAPADEDSPTIVERKVKSLLNKLTMEKFDSISDQIIAWANKSEKEKDGRTLIQVIKLVFEKATDEATWSEMYARLCRKMMEQISPKVQDDGIRNAEGKHITGGHLFRKVTGR
ncbi:hypothetical protein PHLGIDRAFT_114747 [Phlebiopsis gigantea 11061_1 CR5-6]|uniref:MIF4G domain-containing protein n=1 Tax=Phlebiopsis gigantea (strain 11061_1 CR5-6) TaxID=745531 RepID=A0A0C3SCZ5_PHLG1|nr:hypothetical protein PHLGIDRAFT_114747 [Phlebiopsis gigantea 11061_1 CR5-6]